MTHAHDLSMLPLARRTLLSLAGGRGKGLAVFSGRVWITEESDLDDKIIVAGESIVLARPGLVLVEALEPSQVMLFDRMWVETGRAAHAKPGVAQIGHRALALRRRAIRAAIGSAVRAATQAVSGWWQRATPFATRRVA